MPAPTSWSPVFLVGCGRSGTTILGKVLNQHRDVHVVNEPRYIWRAINPDTDIWYALDRRPNTDGKLFMAGEDATARDSKAATRMFYACLLGRRRKHLVEKLPINCFRIEYLKAIFPASRFIHIVRHGLEVAHSIAREGDRWYGPNDGRKWNLLASFAETRGYDRSFLDSCDTHLAKGLMEWTLSVETAQAGFDTTSSNHITVGYDELLSDPKATLAQIEAHLAWTSDAKMHEYSEESLQRRNKTASQLEMPTQTCDRTHQLLAELKFD